MITKQPVGRPNKMEQSLVKHLEKKYAGKTFTSKTVGNSFHLQLLGRDSGKQVVLGMHLKKLNKKGTIEVVGEEDTGKRGNNLKVYRLKRANKHDSTNLQ